jgi:hypothetical protein
MIQVLIQVALEQHNVNTNISAADVYEILDQDQLQIFRDSMEWNLIRTTSSSHLAFELGNYPMKPWINTEDNPNQANFKVEQVKL